MKNDKQAQVFHFDMFGKRQDKYDFLENHSIGNIKWNELQPESPGYFLVSKDFEGKGEYEKGFKIDEIFNLYNSGLATEFDELTIKDTRKEAQLLINDLNEFKASEIISKYNLNIKKIGKVENAIKDIKSNKAIVTAIDYRPFDFKYTVYTGFSNGIMGRPRDGIMKHMLRSNLALLTCRQQTSFEFQHLYISNKISERCSVSLQTGEVNYIFPLYLYPETKAQQTIGQITTPVFDHPSKGESRTPNLNMEIVNQIAKKLGLTFVPEKESEGNVCFINNAEVRPDFRSTFAPIDILDYIYAVLHSPIYREKYKEFLKIDFPRVPYPKGKDAMHRASTFWQLVELGSEIRQIHLLESPVVDKYITQYPIDGNNIVVKPRFLNSPPSEGWLKAGVADSPPLEGWSETGVVETPSDTSSKTGVIGRVYINDTQYFDNVSEIAWEFYIGGYQPVQKWLKDRHGRTLNFEDILHYQKIIVALTETHRLMQEVDKVGVE